MADPRAEVALLKHYRLRDPFPETWSDPIEDAQIAQRKQSRASTSRYSILQEDGASASLRGLVGGDVYSSGVVAEDEPDPLGTADSVVRVLNKKGLPVRENVRLRNRYLVSSKTFSPAAFLRDVHATTPSPALQQGLNHLSTSIAQKSGSLKLLVESNFDRFVAAKGTIEGVYREMGESSFLDGGKESEWGVGKIRGYLNDAGGKADEVFGPAMRGRGREEGLRVALAVVEKHKSMLEVPGNLSESIKRKDYESLIEEYQKARGFLDESRKLVPTGKITIKEEYIHQLVIAESMWSEVVVVVEAFKRETWKKLSQSSTEGNLHLELIGILLELGVDDNPVWFWLLSRYDNLKNRVGATFERSRVEIEILRRKVAEAPAPSPQSVAHHLRSPSRRAHLDSQKALDTHLITSLWELIYSSLSALLSPSSGLVEEILSFQKTSQSFIDGDILLPVGIDDQSRKHHRLEPADARKLQGGICELAVMIRDCLGTFFIEPPVEDISSLYTPVSATAGTSEQGANFPLANPATPAPKTRAQSDEDENYAFIPPGTNCLSGLHYMGKILVLAGNASVAVCEMVSRLGRTDIAEKFRAVVSGSRERVVVAICGAWLKDAGDCKYLEDWTRAGDNRDVTRMPGLFGAFEREVIGGMQAIVYLDKVARSDSSVIPPPSAKLLSHVRSQFVHSLYKSLQGMVENAKEPLDLESWDDSEADLASPITSVAPRNLTAYSVDSKDKNVRILLTLSNLQLLRNDVVPELIGAFENAFSVKLTDESKTIRDAQSQIDAQLFEEYTKPLVSTLSATIHQGILSPSWPPSPPGAPATTVRPYIYTCLLSLVLVHSQITTTAPSLTHPILSFLLEAISKHLLEAFKLRQKFTLGDLLQATLDVEFVNQTLSQYNTPRASELQQGVYVELDRGSDAEARLGLQKGLGSMKKILGDLRRGSRAEFLCFRAKRSSSRRPTAAEA